MPVDPPLLDAPAIFAILDAHQVQYVVVGGYAAQIHGSSRVTTDVDVTPDRSPPTWNAWPKHFVTSAAASASATSTKDSPSTPPPTP